MQHVWETIKAAISVPGIYIRYSYIECLYPLTGRTPSVVLSSYTDVTVYKSPSGSGRGFLTLMNFSLLIIRLVVNFARLSHFLCHLSVSTFGSFTFFFNLLFFFFLFLFFLFFFIPFCPVCSSSCSSSSSPSPFSSRSCSLNSSSCKIILLKIIHN